MLSDNPISFSVLSRIDEEVTLALELMERVPGESEQWRPDWPSESAPPFTLKVLCWHLCESFAGICAVSVRLRGGSDPQAEALRARVADGRMGGIGESRALLADLAAFARDRFGEIADMDLARSIPTTFVPAGKPALSVILTNLAHFTNHKYQLFLYLKLLGVPVTTQDLYRFDP
ncbi:MAG: hypothetical protein ABI972_12925 [Acidobacteriota bacterium]